MKPHAFVAMPFGVKPDADGNPVDFNRVYAELIRPAVEAAGLEVFRADEEQRAGNIRTDMFQELLMADLVVADLTVDNPNVWYELGVRHALRARGVVLVCGGRVTTAFDLYTDRKLRYGIAGGGPDPTTREEDLRSLTAMVRETMECWHGRKISPVYHLMPHLQEPDWQSLRIGGVREFWERHGEWEDRIHLARQSARIGDILVLAEEGPVAAFRGAAWIRAGVALRKAGHYDFALELLERGLAISPADPKGLQEKGICLQRLAVAGRSGHSLERARQHYRKALEIHPGDPELWALLGRVDKDDWVRSWRREGATPEEMREDAEYEAARLRAAVRSYREGYGADLGHYYSGINALTLMHLHRHLTGEDRYDKEMGVMAGAVRFAAESESDRDQIFWAKATLGDIEVLLGTPETVRSAYRSAIARNDRDWFALDSCLAQLLLLRDLGFRPEAVSAGIEVFERALGRLQRPADTWRPRRVFLFAGHMVDAPDRPEPRFPEERVPAAAVRIAQALEELGAGPDDLALTQGACGGDLLFTEACHDRGVRVLWLQPFAEPEFIQRSVVCRGEDWRKRYLEAREKLAAPPQGGPDFLGSPPAGAGESYPFERCNRWLLHTALSHGIEKVWFVCLWNGEGGDAAGGTAHMYGEVEHRTAQVRWIDSRSL